MASIYDINTTSQNTPIDYGTTGFYLNIAARDANLTLSNNERYKRILTKTQLFDLYGGINNIIGDIARMDLYHLSGLVPIYLYKDFNDIREEDDIDIILLDQIGTTSGSGFISYLESVAGLAELNDALLFGNITNVGFSDPANYNINYHDTIALFYSFLYYDNYHVTLAAEFITAVQFSVKNNLIFCGVNHRVTGRYQNISDSVFSVLLRNNTNVVRRNYFLNNTLLSGKHIMAKLGHKYIKSRIRMLLKKFIGRQHNAYLWQDVRESIRMLFVNEFFKYLCGPKKVHVICDETNNITSSTKLNVEIHYEGAYTEDMPFSRQVRITIDL